MQNLKKNPTLPFWRLKTFNEKLNASIGFLKLNWKPLFKANILIAGPLFVFGIGLIIYFSDIFFQSYQANPEKPGVGAIIGFVFSILIGGLFYGLSVLSITIVTFEVIKTKYTAPDKLNDLNYIFKNAKKRFPKMLGIMIISVAGNFLVSMILQFASILLLVLGPIIGTILFVPLYAFGNIVVFSYIYIIIPTAYYEKMSTSHTIGKGFSLIKDKFWQTAGMYLGAKTIQQVIVFGFIIPILIAIISWIVYKEDYYDFTEMYSQSESRKYFLFSMLFAFLYLFISILSNIFHIVTSAVQYFSLKEEKENHLITQQITEFEEL